jgi:haloalkane dehalogenase
MAPVMSGLDRKEAGLEILRTPDERFDGLPDYPFAPNYVQVPSGEGDELRMHYLDEGKGPVVLLLHGEPSWSFLYRKMIPLLTQAGSRAIAPDLIGFGRSDKPAYRSDYTFERHVAWTRAFLEQLDLSDVTLFCQDWGGLIGLRLVAETDRITRVVASNTFLPTGDFPLGEAFHKWRDFSQTTEQFPIGLSVQKGTVSDLSDEVIAAYDAPFPDESFKEGARQFPMLVPASPDDPAAPACRAAWESLSKFDGPFVTAFGDSDPITRGADLFLQNMIPGAAGQPHVTLQGGGHFIQEDKPEELVEVIRSVVLP